MVEVQKIPSRSRKKVDPSELAAQAEAISADAAAQSAAAAEKAGPREPKLDNLGRSYGTGRRKDSVARVYVKRGSGQVIINGKPQNEYFRRQTQLLILNQPFLIAGVVNQFDVSCTVAGGGLSGQAGAIRHGISRALDNFDPTMHGVLKHAGLLTRDSRVVERKKVGLHKARRSKQWAKR